MMHVVHDLIHTSLLLVRHHSLAAIFVLIVLEDCGIPLPLPGNILLLFLGYQVSLGRAFWLATLAPVSLATWLGSIILYSVALQVGRPALLTYGRYVGLDDRRVERIEQWLRRFGPGAVMIGRCIPGLRNPTSAISGTFGVPITVFAMYSAISSVAWSAFWLLAGTFLGRRISLNIEDISVTHMVIGAVFFAALYFALPVLGAFNVWRERRALERSNAPQQTANSGE